MVKLLFKVNPDEDMDYGECPVCDYKLDPYNDKSGTIEDCDTYESVKKKLLINHFKAEPSCKELLLENMYEEWLYNFLYLDLNLGE